MNEIRKTLSQLEVAILKGMRDGVRHLTGLDTRQWSKDQCKAAIKAIPPNSVLNGFEIGRSYWSRGLKNGTWKRRMKIIYADWTRKMPLLIEDQPNGNIRWHYANGRAMDSQTTSYDLVKPKRKFKRAFRLPYGTPVSTPFVPGKVYRDHRRMGKSYRVIAILPHLKYPVVAEPMDGCTNILRFGPNGEPDPSLHIVTLNPNSVVDQ